MEVKAWYTPTYGTASNTVQVRVPARRLGIAVGRGTFAGADGDSNARLDPFIAVRVK